MNKISDSQKVYKQEVKAQLDALDKAELAKMSPEITNEEAAAYASRHGLNFRGIDTERGIAVFRNLLLKRREALQ